MKKISVLILPLFLFACGEDAPQLEKIPILSAETMQNQAAQNAQSVAASNKKSGGKISNTTLDKVLKYKNTPKLNFSNQMSTMTTIANVTQWYAENLDGIEQDDLSKMQENQKAKRLLQDMENWTFFQSEILSDPSKGRKYNGKTFKDLILDLR
ncbi:MAG: hypothetical protein J6T16_03265 [Opitutales bacterium]|nr:hypothetical protein [Opitutales bacterium]